MCYQVTLRHWANNEKSGGLRPVLLRLCVIADEAAFAETGLRLVLAANPEESLRNYRDLPGVIYIKNLYTNKIRGYLPFICLREL